MKILVAQTTDPVIDGIAATCQACEFETMLWDINHMPAFDAMSKSKADYVLIASHQITNEFIAALKRYPTKLILAGMNAPAGLEPDLLIYPNGVKEHTKKHIEALDFPTYGIKIAANFAKYNNGIFNYQYESDVCYYSNIPVPETYRGILENTLFEIPYSYKIVGNHKVNTPGFLGMISLKEVSNFIASSKIGIDIDYHMMYNYAMNRVMCISNQPNDMFPHFENKDDLVEKIDSFIKNDKARRKWVRKVYNQVSENDTYFHRLSDIMTALGNEDLAESVIKKYRVLKK